MRAFVCILSLFLFSSTAVRSAEKPLQLVDAKGVKHHPLVTKDSKATVLLFIAPDCPISNAYAPEISRIVADYQPKQVAFYLVYVDADQKSSAIKDHTEQYKLTPPALLDPKHRLV